MSKTNTILFHSGPLKDDVMQCELRFDNDDSSVCINPDANMPIMHVAGVKYDSLKPSPSLLPINAIVDVIKVLEYGAKKYAENNWQLVEPKSRYYDAAFRHMFAWKSGEDLDDESHLHHLSHAAACLIFLISSHLDGKEIR